MAAAETVSSYSSGLILLQNLNSRVMFSKSPSSVMKADSWMLGRAKSLLYSTQHNAASTLNGIN